MNRKWSIETIARDVHASSILKYSKSLGLSWMVIFLENAGSIVKNL
jgi:hypothetical protein